jgi:hippurate hydrolase
VLQTGREIVGPDLTRVAQDAKMASEDFADMLQRIPGAYFDLGMSPGAPLHNPNYVFDDNVLGVGASMLARLAETRTSEADLLDRGGQSVAVRISERSPPFANVA